MSVTYDKVNRAWDNTDVNVNITDDDGFNGIKDLDNDNASFSEGTLTDVEIVNDSLELKFNLDTSGATDYFGSAGTWRNDTTDEGSIDGFSDVHSIVQTTSYDDIFTSQFTTSDFPNYAGEGNYLYLVMWAKWQDIPRLGNGSFNSVVSPPPDSSKYQKYIFKSDGQDSRDEYFRLFYSTSQTDGSTAYMADPQVYKETEISLYLSTGTRQSPRLDLSPVGTIESSHISWQETLNSQTITIETSTDGGSTWQTATNGGSIPNIAGATTLDVRQTLDTNDTTVTPVLESLEVEVETPIKYKWSLDTTTPSSWNDLSNPVTQSSEGEWYLHTKHFEDNQPVTEYQGTYDIDKTPPVVPNVNLVNNTSHSFSLSWTNSDSLSGIDYVELYAKNNDGIVIDIDGDSNTEDFITLTSTDETYTVDGLLEYSDYDYKVITYDKAGNSSEDGFYTMTTDDITEPIVGYNTNSRDWLNTDVDETVNVDDQDGSGVDQAWYKWTNSATQPTDGWVEMGTTTDFATSQSQEGEWYLHVKATDNYGNTAYDYSGAYKIDKTVPTITSTNITIDSPTGVYDTYTATVEWTIEDDRAGIDRTEVGFYVDGNWYYDEANLPNNITADIDMDNVTGNGSKTATFTNIPREIDIATSWQGYDVATNSTTEEQSSTIYTPRIYETRTAVAPTSYEIGKTNSKTTSSEYEIGITRSTQSPSEYIIDVLSKTTVAPSEYEIGIKPPTIVAPSEYEVGVTRDEYAPALYDIIAQHDKPILVSGKYNQGVRLGLSDLELDVSDTEKWTVHLFRQGEEEKEFQDLFFMSDGSVYLNGEVNSNYNTDWFTFTDNTITIHSGAIDIDELLLVRKHLTYSEIKSYTGSAFYDPNEKITINRPNTASMEVL